MVAQALKPVLRLCATVFQRQLHFGILPSWGTLTQTNTMGRVGVFIKKKLDNQPPNQKNDFCPYVPGHWIWGVFPLSSRIKGVFL
jgi:hypothetical protein